MNTTGRKKRRMNMNAQSPQELPLLTSLHPLLSFRYPLFSP